MLLWVYMSAGIRNWEGGVHTVVRHNFVLDMRQDERDKQDGLAYNDDDGDRNDTVLKFGTFS